MPPRGLIDVEACDREVAVRRRVARSIEYDLRMPVQGDSLTRRLWLDHGRCGTELCRLR
jgi:hypothetical protein